MSFPQEHRSAQNLHKSRLYTLRTQFIQKCAQILALFIFCQSESSLDFYMSGNTNLYLALDQLNIILQIYTNLTISYVQTIVFQIDHHIHWLRVLYILSYSGPVSSFIFLPQWFHNMCTRPCHIPFCVLIVTSSCFWPVWSVCSAPGKCDRLINNVILTYHICHGVCMVCYESMSCESCNMMLFI